MTDLVSTYRVQFNKDFTFTHLEEVIPYLYELGIKTIYASPIFKAVPGSMHGYDVTDPLQINPELGTYEQLRAISRRLGALGMKWLQDIVPNHMAYHPDNRWLMDVLEKGPKSSYYAYFDITASGSEKLMVPFLGDTLERVVAAGALQVNSDKDGFSLRYFDKRYPLNIESYASILDACEIEVTGQLKSSIDEGEIAAVKHLLFSHRYSDNLKLCIDNALNQINADSQRLLEIAARQHYRLCRWRETDRQINYRRFLSSMI